MKRRLISLALALLLLPTLTACGAKEEAMAAAPAASAPAAAAPMEEPAMDMAGAESPADGGLIYSTFSSDRAGVEHNTEEYSHIEENGFQSVSLSPLSTFAADVDTASYANLRRMLLEGADVPADAVRIEEMINYFHYDYPEPEDGEPFSVSTELTPCPWNGDNTLLRIGLQAPQPDWEAMPPANLVFLIDVSGSMNHSNKLPLVKQAFLLLTENLRSTDTISIVTYASRDEVVLSGVSGDDPAAIQTAIETLTAGGNTAGAQGIQTAYALAEEHFIPGGNNRVILATDGDLNVGVTSEGELTRLIEKKKESGVFLSVMGFGDGNLKDNKLESLADHGNGNYAYIDSVLEAKKVLVEEMGGTLFTVAKDVKLQVEFNPEHVKSYRLIGYENRLMDAEDFADDTKDGGEIGAGHRITVLYELSSAEIAGTDLKYQQASPTGSPEWLTLSIRCKAPDGDQSTLLQYPVDAGHWRDTPSSDTAFAACVAQFGMLLRDSEYAGSATYESIYEALSALPGVEEDAYKDELVYLVRKAWRG